MRKPRASLDDVDVVAALVSRFFGFGGGVVLGEEFPDLKGDLRVVVDVPVIAQSLRKDELQFFWVVERHGLVCGERLGGMQGQSDGVDGQFPKGFQALDEFVQGEFQGVFRGVLCGIVGDGDGSVSLDFKVRRVACTDCIAYSPRSDV